MAFSYRVTFRPEKRKRGIALITSNVPLMLDLSCRGRIWYNTGYRLQDIDDFDVSSQKLKSGKKAKKNNTLHSATVVNNELSGIIGHIQSSFASAIALKANVNSKYLINQLRILSNDVKADQPKTKYFIEEFRECVKDLFNLNIIGEGRKKHYDAVCGMIDRFLRINGFKITPDQFTPQMLKDFRNFLFEEHTLISTHPLIYQDLKKRDIPGVRSQNTVASKLKLISPVFKYWEEKDIIPVSPFNKLAKVEKGAMLKQIYDEAICLSLKELQSIINKEVPEQLERVRDCFLLHCAIGMRVEDFHTLTWNNVNGDNGFYHIHYVPSKTSHNADLKPIDTPLVSFAVDIILKYKDTLPGLLAPIYKGNVSGESGYNHNIKELLKHHGITRGVLVRKNGEIKTVQLCDIASSKLARKTNIDILSKVELHKYISGMHSDGSKSVDRYTNLNIEEKFQVYCRAFQQPIYKI